MTILENTSTKISDRGTMISSVADRYITPEYLAPLPTNDKSGKSPLQLLAQTCSQIGADIGGNKLLQEKSNNNNNTDKSSGSNSNSKKSPALIVSDGGRGSAASSTSSLASQSPPTVVSSSKPFSFKPYEPDNVGKKSAPAPSPKAASIVSLSPDPNASPRVRKSPDVKSAPATSSSASTSSSETVPVIRSGLEVLAGHPKDVPLGAYRHMAGLAGLDPSNPAFRPPFGMGYPPTSLAASLAALGVCRDPFCRDPTCPTALYNAQFASLSGAGGFADLLKAHQMAAAVAAAQNGTGLTPPNGLAGPGGPYICNWMNGREGYCGKRHNSAEELLQHLRTHTNLSTSDAAAANAASSGMLSSLYPPGMFGGMNSALAAANLHRVYGGALAASNSLSSSRFHPYAKPGGSGSALAGLGLPPPPPPGLGTLPPSLAALGYNPSTLYALYGSRLSGSSVLP